MGVFINEIVPNFIMKTQRGFVSAAVLLAILLGIVVLGGGAYFVMHQNSAPQTATEQDSNTDITNNGTQVKQPAVTDSSGSATKPVSCLYLTHDLSIGSTDTATGGEVSKLQTFLKTEGATEVAITGSFDTTTSAALQRWQTAHGISITTSGTGVVGPKTRAVMSQNCTGTNTSATSPVAIVNPKAGDVITSGQTSTVQISFSNDFSKKVGGLMDVGNSAAIQPLSMGLLSKRTGEIITMPPPTNRDLWSDVIDGSKIRAGNYTFSFTPRTAVVGSEWNNVAPPTYLVPGQYKVVVYTRNAISENAIGKIYVTNDDWFTVNNGSQNGVAFAVTQPQAGQSFSKGSTLSLRWNLTGSDANFVPKYFSAELVPADQSKMYTGVFSGFSSCRLTSTFTGIAIPQSNTFDWVVPVSGTGVPHLADPEIPLCSMTGVPSGQYRIVASVSSCSGFGCDSYSSNPEGISDSSGIIEIK